MVDPQRIRGDTGLPFGPEQAKEVSEVDSDKFKKILKIDESEESQKRHKRKLRKEEEEGDVEEKVPEKAPEPATSFAQYLEDKEDLGTMFDAQSAGIKKRAAPKSTFEAPPPGAISVEGIEEEEIIPGIVEYEMPPPLPPPELERGALPPPPAAPVPGREAAPPLPYAEGMEKPPEAPPSPEAERKEAPLPREEPDTSLLAEQPKKGALKVAPKKRPKKARVVKEEKPVEKEIPAKKEEEKPLVGKEEGAFPKEVKPEERETAAAKIEKAPEEKEVPPKIAPKEEEAPKYAEAAGFRPFSPEEVRQSHLRKKEEAAATAALEGISPPPPEGEEMGMLGEEKKEKKKEFPEATAATASIPLPTSDVTLPPVVPSPETPAYATLSPQVNELFSQMVGAVIIVHDSGVTTTTIVINMPGSVFDQTQVKIDQYSTAPMSYNIQLIGTPQAVAAFTDNLADLAAAFKQGEYAFETNILKPILQPRARKRVEAAGKGKRGG
jgi:hypothetical protein